MNINIPQILSTIEQSLNEDIFIDVENQNIELKELNSNGEWNSFYETVCAFLNTNGGYIICGIKEHQEKNTSNKKYIVTGFNKNNEGKLIDLNDKFKDDNRNVVQSISENINLEYHILHNQTIAVVEISPLRKDLKYISYKDFFYERKLSRDSKIAENKLQEQKEYKRDYFDYAKELSIIPDANINDLNLEKINNYIFKLKTIGLNENLKNSLGDSKDFLIRKYCIKENDLTTLGLLLFGNNPFEKLEYRCEVDCYYSSENTISKDDKVFKNDVLNLIDDTFIFIWNHINIGRTQSKGGQALPEYPEKLIRETINNAIAHRDYFINKFITIKIAPFENIKITNPGNFKQKMLILDTSTPIEIRRIKAGLVETQNPKLADFLKTYKKIESQGIGISTLVTECLDNKIDVPYYDLSKTDEVTLVIQNGELIDDEIVHWLNSYENFIQSKIENYNAEHKAILAYFYKSQKLNLLRKYTILLNEDNNHLNAILDLKKSYLITEHLTASSEKTPIYILNSVLTKEHFLDEIKKIINFDLEEITTLQKNVLSILYRNNYYNKKSLKPSEITPELYLKLHGKNIEPKKYETLGRQVRKVCADFFEKNILTKFKNSSYSIINI